MPKFLFEANYTPEGAKGIVKEGGSARRAAVEKTVAALGGRLEAFYFAFGAVDAYVIVDLPDNVTAAAMALAVGQSGLASTKTVVLVTPEETDAATKKSVNYRGPGR
jgi:uncharacterized protein with GYD domain